MFNRYYDELAIGDQSAFRGVTITDWHIQEFAAVTGDHYVLHTDDEYAKATPFGQRVAHGLLVLSSGAGCVPLEPGRVVALLGMDEVHFLKPTYVGDTLHPEMEVVGKRDSGPGGVVTVEETILNQRGETVCTARIKVLMALRPTDVTLEGAQ